MSGELRFERYELAPLGRQVVRSAPRNSKSQIENSKEGCSYLLKEIGAVKSPGRWVSRAAGGRGEVVNGEGYFVFLTRGQGARVLGC